MVDMQSEELVSLIDDIKKYKSWIITKPKTTN